MIYLASPYGFSNQWKPRILPKFVSALEGVGAEAQEPLQLNIQVEYSQSGWVFKVAIADLKGVKDSDAILAIVNGTPPDEEVMVELDAAIALEKPTFLFRDDFRKCTDSEEYPLNLMLFAGLPAEN